MTILVDNESYSFKEMFDLVRKNSVLKDSSNEEIADMMSELDVNNLQSTYDRAFLDDEDFYHAINRLETVTDKKECALLLASHFWMESLSEMTLLIFMIKCLTKKDRKEVIMKTVLS